MRVVLGLTGFSLGVILAMRRLWIVSHPASQVLLKMQETLQATCVAHRVVDNSVEVTSTGTRANIRRWGPISLVEFYVVDSLCNKERFLLEVLTKYLRFIGNRDADG